METLKTGYYFIKLSQDKPWQIAKWYSNLEEWWVVGKSAALINKPYVIDNRLIERLEPSTNKTTTVKDKMGSLAVGESFSVEYFIKTIWGEVTAYNRRSFDVMVSTSRAHYQDRAFKVIKGNLTRVL